MSSCVGEVWNKGLELSFFFFNFSHSLSYQGMKGSGVCFFVPLISDAGLTAGISRFYLVSQLITRPGFSNAELRGTSLVIREEKNGLFGKTICECLYVSRAGDQRLSRDKSVTRLAPK